MTGMTLELAHSIKTALANAQPVVALETSIISQGLPYPANYRTALNIEDRVQENGALPATIGVCAGKIRIGMDRNEIHDFATRQDILKLSNADLPYALVKSVMGATTVSATLVCADLAGIKVVATGGMGGIHRDYNRSHDESRDLHQLAMSSAIVVASGIKAILDIPRTLEKLDTLGVAVITLGQEEFPAFWSRHSGQRSPMQLNSIQEIVDFYQFRTRLGNNCGMLVANPVPAEAEIPREIMNGWIDTANEHIQAEKVTGKQVTPYLLNKINELSAGKSVETNQSLVSDNARVAALIACGIQDSDTGDILV